MSSVPSKEELESVFSGLDICNITSVIPTEPYILENGDLGALALFAKRNGDLPVFVERMFLDLDRILIKEEHYAGLPLPILGGVQLDSHMFNRDIRAMDLGELVEMRVFVLYQGRPFGAFFINSELDTLRRLTPEERVERFVEVRRQRLKDNVGLIPRKEDPLLEKFSEMLMVDSQYRALKNDNDRFNHIIKVSRRPGNDQIRKGIMKSDGSGFSTDAIRKLIVIVERKTDPHTTVLTQMVFGERKE